MTTAVLLVFEDGARACVRAAREGLRPFCHHSRMDADWTPQAVVESVRRHLGEGVFELPVVVDRVDLVGPDVLVVLSGLHTDVLHGVRFSLDRVPVGPLTGEVCDSVDEWGAEVAIALDEAIGTREIERAERRTEPDGVVLLRWWPGDSWSH